MTEDPRNRATTPEAESTTDAAQGVDTGRRKLLDKAAYEAPKLIVLGSLLSIKETYAASPDCILHPEDPRCPPGPPM